VASTLALNIPSSATSIPPRVTAVMSTKAKLAAAIYF
jgi:hypothetical protein